MRNLITRMHMVTCVQISMLTSYLRRTLVSLPVYGPHPVLQRLFQKSQVHHHAAAGLVPTCF